MALEEHDREDLLGEGRNMPWRGACVIDDVEMLVGFRKQGQVSLFCGVDPVFQFNVEGRLRRVYFEAGRYRAEEGRLVSMRRTSRGGKVEFETASIDHETEARLHASLQAWIRAIDSASDSRGWRVEGETRDAFLMRLRAWLSGLPETPTIADRPNA
jgi:hypothetical protein